MISSPISILENTLVLSDKSSTSAAGSAGWASAGRAFILSGNQKKKWAELVQKYANEYSKKTILEGGPKDLLTIPTAEGPVWILFRREPEGPYSHGGSLEESNHGWFRDQGGVLWSLFRLAQVDAIHVEFVGLNRDQTVGLLTGWEMAGYNFKENFFAASGGSKALKAKGDSKSKNEPPKPQFPKIHLKVDKKLLHEAQALGRATNLARHLVNLPPNIAHPQSLGEFAKKEFKGRRNMTVEVWDLKRLEKEKMGLIIGVGQGSASEPCLVHFRYRPRSSKKPIAFVGKGVTFDTGGLDIKPSSGMRLMKKDMGGSAAVMGIAWWLSEANYPAPVDLYLALAENSVDAKSFRPSDVLIARNGMSVEIHNTDAEGRLVLADALDVAVTQTGKDEPEAVINVATLTGAIKTALGLDISGMFSNDDKLANQLLKAGQASGELSWRMPLYSRYTANFSTPFADMVNAVDGWGGPITAALFLEKFVARKPWAHFDVYAWSDKATGALQTSGGNGQTVQTLTRFLTERL